MDAETLRARRGPLRGAATALAAGRLQAELLALGADAASGRAEESVLPNACKLRSVRKIRIVDSTSLGNSLWTYDFHPLQLRICLSQNL